MISIIIPTYNRSKELETTLKGYANQTYKRLIREIVIIDDGSTDDTRKIVEKMRVSAGSDYEVVYLFQKNSGPAKARNEGIQKAKGEIILITGDDIIPDEELIQEHFLAHKKNNFKTNVCVLGQTKWPPDMKVTPFMRHIQNYGLQFGYSIIKDRDDVPFNFFYTSNISLNRSFVSGTLFSTDFPYAAWEDVEFGYRLQKKGMRLVYNERAIGYHNHRISFMSFRKRQLQSGYSAGICFALHSEIEKLLGMQGLRLNKHIKIWEIKIAEAFCVFAEKSLPFPFPWAYNLVMSYYYGVGFSRYLAGEGPGAVSDILE